MLVPIRVNAKMQHEVSEHVIDLARNRFVSLAHKPLCDMNIFHKAGSFMTGNLEISEDGGRTFTFIGDAIHPINVDPRKIEKMQLKGKPKCALVSLNHDAS